MDPIQKEHIILRVSEEFLVTSFKKHYYCSKVSLENLKFRLKSFHGLDSTIFVCIDHDIVKEVNGQLFVYLRAVTHWEGAQIFFIIECEYVFHCSLQSPRACFPVICKRILGPYSCARFGA